MLFKPLLLNANEFVKVNDIGHFALVILIPHILHCLADSHGNGCPQHYFVDIDVNNLQKTSITRISGLIGFDFHAEIYYSSNIPVSSKIVNDLLNLSPICQ